MSIVRSTIALRQSVARVSPLRKARRCHNRRFSHQSNTPHRTPAALAAGHHATTSLTGSHPRSSDQCSSACRLVRGAGVFHTLINECTYETTECYRRDPHPRGIRGHCRVGLATGPGGHPAQAQQVKLSTRQGPSPMSSSRRSRPCRSRRTSSHWLPSSNSGRTSFSTTRSPIPRATPASNATPRRRAARQGWCQTSTSSPECRRGSSRAGATLAGPWPTPTRHSAPWGRSTTVCSPGVCRRLLLGRSRPRPLDPGPAAVNQSGRDEQYPHQRALSPALRGLFRPRRFEGQG